MVVVEFPASMAATNRLAFPASMAANRDGLVCLLVAAVSGFSVEMSVSS
jgi:hypothetical protein